MNPSVKQVRHQRKRLLRLAASFACILLLCSACYTVDDDDIIPGRVLIAYLADDNNLSAETEQRINALASGFFHAGTGDAGNRLFIYCDTRNASPRLVEITNTHNGPRRLIKTYPPQNSADAAVMAQVLRDVLAGCTAGSYGLVVFSHGTAWLPAGGLENPYSASGGNVAETPATRTVAVDGNDELELTDFAAALPLPGGRKWSFILFENCYMASVEVAYELKDKTEAVIASVTEVVSPGMTEVYPLALPYLYQENPALERFAQACFDHWNALTGDYRSATISVIRTARLAELASLARAAFVRWRPDAATISALQRFNRNPWHLFFDLRQTMLTANPALESFLDGLLPEIVTYSAATPSFIEGEPYGFKIDHCCGLSCYIPQAGFDYLNSAYGQTAWGGAVAFAEP